MRSELATQPFLAWKTVNFQILRTMRRSADGSVSASLMGNSHCPNHPPKHLFHRSIFEKSPQSPLKRRALLPS